MADRNIQIKNKKGSTWDNLYPITTMDNVFDNNGKALPEQLAEKVDKGNVSVSDINKNLGKLDQTFMTEEFIQQMAGTTPVNAVPDKKSITTDMIASRAVGVTETNYLRAVSTNLFNKAVGVLVDKAVDPNGGGVTDYTGYSTTDYIEIKPLTIYKASIIGNMAFYDTNKSYVSGMDYTTGTTFTTPADVKYIRFSYISTETDSLMFVEGSTLPTKYIPYGYQIATFDDIEFNDNAVDVFPNTIITNEELEEESVSPETTSFLDVKLKNLFNKNDVFLDKGVNNVNGLIYTAPDYITTNFIEIKPNTIYKGREIANKAYYSESKVFISGESWVETQLTTSPSNAKFIRFSFHKSFLDRQMFVVGDTLPSSYLPYGSDLVSFKNVKFADGVFDDFPAIPSNKSKLYGKKWNALGDSITANVNGYHKLIAEKTGCVVRNYGIISSTVADYYEWETNPMVLRYMEMDDDVDIITVFGGVNDAGNGMPMGDINSIDKTTFYGAYNVLLEGLIKKYPTKIIATFTPLKTTGRPDLGKIVNAVKEVSAKYGVPCLDLHNMSGLSTVQEQMTLLMPDKLHPNDQGHKIIGGKILSFLESIMPIEL